METSPLPPSLPPPASSNDKLLIILCHLSLILGLPFILPLIIFLVKRDESSLVVLHTKEVLNFHISLLIYSLCISISIFLCIGYLLLIALWLAAIICAFIAAFKASEGEFYRYPVTLRFIS